MAGRWSRRGTRALVTGVVGSALAVALTAAPALGPSLGTASANTASIPTSSRADPRGQAPCVEGSSRTSTLYTQSFESGLPESRFVNRFARSTASGAAAGSYSARASLTGTGSSAYFFLPYVLGSVGTQTRLAFAYRSNAAQARNTVALNSFASSLPTSTSWRGAMFDVTSATRDEGGWLGAWFQHNVTPGSSTYMAVDNVQLFTCRPNATERIAGSSRYATAALLADRFDPGVPVVFVARGDNFPDALSASAAAAAQSSPVLLSLPSQLPTETAAALEHLQPEEIIVVGNEGSVSKSVATSLEAYAPVRRLGGVNRYETSALIAAEFPPEVPVVFLATGLNFADAMTGGALVGHRGGPLLLTPPDALSEWAREELARLQPQEIVVLGTHPTVTDTVLQQATLYAPTVRRIGGANRYATAALIASEFPTSVPHTYLATGTNFPDGLAAGALAGSEGVPLLISAPRGMAPETTARLTAITERRGYLLGMEDALNSLVRDQYGRTLP